MAEKSSKKTSKTKKSFIKDLKAELKKVVWPTPKQIVANTTGVIIIVIITAIIVFALDFTFDSINKYGINQLKGIVNETSQDESAVNVVEDTSNVVNDTTNVVNDVTNIVE